MNKKLPANLIVLMYGKNCCYPHVVDTEIEGLKICLKTNKWSFKNRSGREIGSFDYLMKDFSSGVIGVYDRTNTEHLGAMIRDWQGIQDAKEGRFGE